MFIDAIRNDKDFGSSGVCGVFSVRKIGCVVRLGNMIMEFRYVKTFGV